MNGSGYLVSVLMLMAAAISGGCYGPSRPADDGPSTAQVRIDSEIVPNAVLARVDTSPNQKWRYGFKRPGADQLLVFTRITSTETDSNRNRVARYDKYFERVWITIPIGTPLGAELSLEDLEQYFLVGYDRDVLATGYFIHPSRVTGKLRILERNPDDVVVKINALVAPTRMDNWRLEGTWTVKVVTDGHHATRAEEVVVYHAQPIFHRVKPYDPNPDFGGPNLVSAEPSEPTSGDSPPATNADLSGSGVGSGGPSSESDEPSPPKAPSSGTAAGEEPAAATIGPGTIMGRWFGATPPHPRGHYEVHFQFNYDNTFVHSTSRGGGGGGGYPPGMKYGTFKVRDGLVLLEVKKFVFQKENINHLPPKGMFLILKIAPDSGNLILSGDFGHPIGDEEKLGKNVSIRLSRRDFPDLRVWRPKANLREGYDKAPEPDYKDIIGLEYIKKGTR